MSNSAVRKMDGWTKLTLALYWGFFVGGRYFSFLAGPLLPVIVFNRALCARAYRALVRKDPLTYFCWALLLSLMYGTWEVVYGLVSGYDPVTVFEVFVFNFCPLYLFLGLWAGASRPTMLRTIIRVNAWYSAFYALLYFCILRPLHVEALGEPSSGSGILLGLFCFEPHLGPFWLPILTSSFTMIADQKRSDWAGFLVAVILWGLVKRQMGRLFTVVGVSLGLLAIGFVFDIRMPGLPGRGGEISARDTVGRALSSFNPSLAKEYNKDADTFAGTVQWREKWWTAIREEIGGSYWTEIFGLGYGFPLADLVPYLRGSGLRTPHSILYFTLGYSGYLGLGIFFLLQASLMGMHWQTFKATGQAYGLIFHAAVLTASLFGNLLEAPQMAIPCYLMFGMSMGRLFERDLPMIAVGLPKVVRSRVASVPVPVRTAS